jgi:poly-gamma-glutamate biosynthesis protein PgsC/CapC
MDAQVVAIAVGLMISLLFTEAFGLSAGGMIVPGYFALSLHRPGAVVMTILAAALTYLVVRLVSKRAIIYGRRRIVMMIVVGFTVGMVFRQGWDLMVGGADQVGALAPLAIIGFIIPGLIALWFDRQGIVETTSTLLTSSILVRLVLILMGMEVLV